MKYQDDVMIFMVDVHLICKLKKQFSPPFPLVIWSIRMLSSLRLTSSIAMKNSKLALKVLRDCVTENCWWHLYLSWRNLLLLLYFCSKWAGHQPCCNCSELKICLVMEIQIRHTGSHLFSVIRDSHISPVSWPLWRSSWSNHISHWQALGWTCLPLLNMIFYLLLYLQKQFFLAGHIKHWQTSKENWIQQTW